MSVDQVTENDIAMFQEELSTRLETYKERKIDLPPIRDMLVFYEENLRMLSSSIRSKLELNETLKDIGGIPLYLNLRNLCGELIRYNYIAREYEREKKEREE